MNDTPTIEEPEGHTGGQEESYKDIVLSQLRKCIKEFSKEHSLGGFNQRIVNGETVEIYTENTFDVIKHSIEGLRMLLLPRVLDNKKYLLEYFAAFEYKLFNAKNRKRELIATLNKNYPNPSQNEVLRKSYNQQYKRINEEFQMKEMYAYKEVLEALSILLGKVNYLGEDVA
jgi:hypothetical protein|tara:strand:- start:5683 stop:6198 length:516 start_codon:yes stop_codon:yes gene_type:complete